MNIKLVISVVLLMASVGGAVTIRYRLSGSWEDLSDGASNGWQGGVMPGSADTVRFNWADNTVTLDYAAPTVDKFQMGVDESGGLEVNSGGVLTATGNCKVGNNNLCTGWLTINEGGVVNANGSWTMVAGNSNITGILTINGGEMNVAGHLWVATGADSTGTVNINGGTLTVGENFALGSVDAVNPSGGVGFVNLKDGLLALDHWNSIGSIQAGSFIDIYEGIMTIPGDQRVHVQAYIYPPSGPGRIIAYGGTGIVHYDYNVTTNKTTIWAEPASSILGTGDVDGDGDVDATDLFLFTAQWLQPDPDPDADFTGDGDVNMEDFQILAKNWLHNEYSKTLTGKIMCGYQGWFNYPGDGAGRGWTHWGTSDHSRFEPGYCTVDWWPDMSEYDADEKFATGFNYADGSTAYVFSSHNKKTVLRHFSWMEQYGIDGVFLQRFASETTPGSSARNHRDQVMLYCQEGANLHKRAWAMMYDLSTNSLTGPQLKQKVIDDWKHLVDTYKITQDPTDAAYLHHNGKPVVAVWGLGFERAYEGEDTYDIINFLKNDPTYGGCTVMIGVDNEWRERKDTDTWLQQIVDLADIISPWAVGRYGSKTTGGLDDFTTDHTIPDQIWCNANNKDYLPVVFPGFSWQNLQQNNKFDQTPRLGGAFLWRQIYKAINDAGVTMIYQAMFDEVDEGTAIFKCTNAPPVAELPTSVFSNPFLPTGNAQHAPYDPSDASLPSDHYLWLVGEAAKMLTGERVLTETMPIR